jgi:hypothetical protein
MDKKSEAGHNDRVFPFFEDHEIRLRESIGAHLLHFGPLSRPVDQ